MLSVWGMFVWDDFLVYLIMLILFVPKSVWSWWLAYCNSVTCHHVILRKCVVTLLCEEAPRRRPPILFGLSYCGLVPKMFVFKLCALRDHSRPNLIANILQRHRNHRWSDLYYTSLPFVYIRFCALNKFPILLQRSSWLVSWFLILTSERFTAFVFLVVVWSRIPAICATEERHRQLPGVLPAAAESAPHSRRWCATGIRWRPWRPASHQQWWQLPQSTVFRQSSAEDYHPEER